MLLAHTQLEEMTKNLDSKLEGLLLVDKPVGPTSHDVVQLVKEALEVEKAGHVGTLDPSASGLLIVCLNDAVKAVQFLMGLDKEYIGEMTLGIETDTQDREGKITSCRDISHISEEQIKEAFSAFVGKIVQSPPLYSAVKKGGVRMYELARKGIKENPPPREVFIKELEILSVVLPKITFRALVSSGTYIRSLVSDIGRKLGVGAHLSELRRTKVGGFKVEDAIPAEKLKSGPGKRMAIGAVLPLRLALYDFPEIRVKGNTAWKVLHGGGISEEDVNSGEVKIEGKEGNTAKVVDDYGRVIAIMKRVSSRNRGSDSNKVLWHPLRVWSRNN